MLLIQDLNMEIKDALNARNKIDLKAKIISLSEPRVVNMKGGGTIDVKDAMIEDSTGKMKLTLWGEDCQKFAVNDNVEITNGYTNTFKGDVSLGTGKYGSITKV